MASEFVLNALIAQNKTAFEVDNGMGSGASCLKMGVPKQMLDETS
jgi:hypothetical protein